MSSSFFSFFHFYSVTHILFHFHFGFSVFIYIFFCVFVSMVRLLCAVEMWPHFFCDFYPNLGQSYHFMVWMLPYIFACTPNDIFTIFRNRRNHSHTHQIQIYISHFSTHIFFFLSHIYICVSLTRILSRSYASYRFALCSPQFLLLLGFIYFSHLYQLNWVRPRQFIAIYKPEIQSKSIVGLKDSFFLFLSYPMYSFPYAFRQPDDFRTNANFIAPHGHCTRWIEWVSECECAQTTEAGFKSSASHQFSDERHKIHTELRSWLKIWISKKNVWNTVFAPLSNTIQIFVLLFLLFQAANGLSLTAFIDYFFFFFCSKAKILWSTANGLFIVIFYS